MMAVDVNKIKNEQCTGEIPIRTMRRLRRAEAYYSLKRYCALLFAKFSKKNIPNSCTVRTQNCMFGATHNIGFWQILAAHFKKSIE